MGEVKLDLSSKIFNRKEACLSEEHPKLNGSNREEKCILSDLDFTAMMSSFRPFIQRYRK